MKRLKKDLLLLDNRLIEKVEGPCNAKEQYRLFIRKKNRKSAKQSEIITYQPKTFETFDIQSVITEHPKTSLKSCKTIRQSDKVGCNSSLYSDTKISENILNEKNAKIAKQEHAFKGFASTYNVETLTYFNPELQLQDTESANKSKLTELFTQLKGFQFVTTLVFVFKKIEIEDNTRFENFDSSSKA